MKDLLPGVDYQGSFMMNGPRFITSDDKNPATMIFYRGGKKFITVTSTKFVITSSKLNSESASVKIFIDSDSIYNDGITMRYVVSDNKVTLINSSKRNYYSPIITPVITSKEIYNAHIIVSGTPFQFFE